MKSTFLGQGKQILLVDDDPNLILLVRDYLQFHKYEVLAAADGSEGLEILSQHKPDLIICDAVMPDLDGFAFVKQIKSHPQTASIPALMLSAKGQSQDRLKGLQAGADIYMVKPFELEELIAQIESCLRQAARLSSFSLGDRQPKFAPVNEEVPLTNSELKVLHYVAAGMANSHIAAELGLSCRTVESYVSNILKKTGARNRTELARWYCTSRQLAAAAAS